MRRSFPTAVLLAAALNGALAPFATIAWATEDRRDAEPVAQDASQAAVPQPETSQPETPQPEMHRPVTARRATAKGAGRRSAIRTPGASTLRLHGEDHAGYGRVILPGHGRGSYAVAIEDDRLVITYPPVRETSMPTQMPRNVTGITEGAVQTVITTSPGSQMRVQRQGSALIIDILDPAPTAPTTGASPPPAKPEAPPPNMAPSGVAPSGVATGVTPAAGTATAAVAPVTAVPLAAIAPAASTDAAQPVTAVPATTMPAATPILLLENAPQPAILLRADSTVGLAAFRDDADMVVVLDAPLAFDTTALSHDPVFGRATVTPTQDATVIRIPLAAPASLRAARGAPGWVVSTVPTPDAVVGIAPRSVDQPAGATRLQLPATMPSRVVTVPGIGTVPGVGMDADSGSQILVGTQGSSGQGVANQRSLAQFTLLPTVQGVAVAVRSDDVTLRREPDGFSLSAGRHPSGAVVSAAEAVPPLPPGATQLSRMFDFPDLPLPALIARLTERVAVAANAPAQERAPPRQRVAEAMVALGLGVEAQGVLDLASATNPAIGDQPETIALKAIAALVGYRPDAAQGLSDPRLSDSHLADSHLAGAAEIRLWRALLAADRDEASPRAARNLARTIPLLLSYPAGLRARFLPTALQTMALGGQLVAARAVLDRRPDDRTLDLARGMVHEMAGEPDAALQAYAAVTKDGNRLARYQALVRGVGVRLTRGDLSPREAADALDRALYAWRGPREELALRIRIADLRRQNGQWRDAITVLREARAAFPEARVALDSELAGIFTALFEGDTVARMAPADFVALYDQNTDLLWRSPLSESAATTLLNRLMALDLPGRTEPVLTRLIAQATDPVRRALLGARLASVRLDANDPTGALAALADTRPPDGGADAAPLSDDVVQTRQLLYARAEAQRGNIDVALGMLTTLGTAEADELRASLCSSRRDWPGAVSALTDLAGKRLPAAGTALDAEQQAIVMRLASAATLAGDQETIGRLRAARGEAMAKGASAVPFEVITSSPVTRMADLPRAFHEIGMARQLPLTLGAAAPAVNVPAGDAQAGDVPAANVPAGNAQP